ncbi:MAG: 50S ribosomal protein L6 [Elusimicrobia bacterium]|nr:50S ribosomal protein L6 [Elusimicrobiota bacterium]
MSRIGRQPIGIPQGVQVEIQSEKNPAGRGNRQAVQGSVESSSESSVSLQKVRVKGPLGETSFVLPAFLTAQIQDGKLTLSLQGEDRKNRAVYGTIRARLANMVQGVQGGFSKILEIQGLGFKAVVEGTEKLTLNMGYSHPVVFQIPKGVKIQVDPKQVVIMVSGSDKDLVGETAARIRQVRVPEPYKGTGVRYRGEHITRKAGKTAAGAGAGAAGGGAKK